MSFWRKKIGMLRAGILVAGILMMASVVSYGQQTIRMSLADGFDFPVGKPNAVGYYKARGLRLTSPIHYGEDWNGRNGGDSDLGDPVYTVADGIVTWAYNLRGGWGNVVIIRHAYRDPSNNQVKFIDSLYAHLHEMKVKVGQNLKRGALVGTIGTNSGMYPAHLHFEMRHNLKIGMHRESVARDMTNWADPTIFIKKHRQLNREWNAVAAPAGTYPVYQGFKGI
jgi:murein DD-endopeptidase MepM/ murein hydrolase activator NlpD